MAAQELHRHANRKLFVVLVLALPPRPKTFSVISEANRQSAVHVQAAQVVRGTTVPPETVPK